MGTGLLDCLRSGTINKWDGQDAHPTRKINLLWGGRRCPPSRLVQDVSCVSLREL
ncbi:hypothetical protein [Microseira wollei]|uniref:hypothetical protein n=1 Tax=Microseira wollei TaxID=467598 RepID=UPI001CFE8044|nr:hypothetical protein [Microseira wollei]